MALSVKTEIQLQIFENMIQECRLFEMADPTFILAIVRKLTQEFSTPQDYICRQGEDAFYFYFIKEGKVDILSTDDASRIATLKEGSYFGEIGLLLQETRSVSVKAKTSCVLASIFKEDFLKIMNDFPK